MPNISLNQLTFTLSEGLNHTSNLTITDAAGRVVLVQDVTANNQEIEVNISDLEQGIYYYNLATEEHSLSGKFIRN